MSLKVNGKSSSEQELKLDEAGMKGGITGAMSLHRQKEMGCKAEREKLGLARSLERLIESSNKSYFGRCGVSKRGPGSLWK